MCVVCRVVKVFSLLLLFSFHLMMSCITESTSCVLSPAEENFTAELKQNGQDDFDLEEVDQPAPASGGYPVRRIKWLNLLWLIVLHCAFVWALTHLCTNQILFYTGLWAAFTSMFSGFGMSVGAHRLWAHRSFQASTLLRFVLLVLQTMTINGSAFSYARDHRNHHKWPATDADPKNPGRGFFFAHIGWWLLRKRPEVLEFGRKVPIDDLLKDKLLIFQHRYYLPLVVLCSFVVPIGVPVMVWHEDPLVAFAVCVVRITVVLHHLFTVNSVAHFWGYRPYNRFMKPTENRWINWISMGEGSHNYHHTFPFDYRNSEFAWWKQFNPASLFIEVCLLLHQAWEPKKPSSNLVHKVIEHKGLPSYFSEQPTRSKQIFFGLFDWLLGSLFAQWPIWFVLLFKLCTGLPVFVFQK